MTRTTVNIATLYSSAQCVLSVVGSVGVILLFAGIPQLIYSPTVSVANLMTFLLGAVLITTMVAGNSFLNYKYRKFTRNSQANQRDPNNPDATESRSEAEDKPPSYEAILSSDGLPPDYFSVLNEKPPKYEDIAKNFLTSQSFSPAVPLEGETFSSNITEVTNATQGLSGPPHSPSPKGLLTGSGGETTATTLSSSSSKKSIITVTAEVTIPNAIATEDNSPSETGNTTEVTIARNGDSSDKQEPPSVQDTTHTELQEAPTTTLELHENIALDLSGNSSAPELRESES